MFGKRKSGLHEGRHGEYVHESPDDRADGDDRIVMSDHDRHGDIDRDQYSNAGAGEAPTAAAKAQYAYRREEFGGFKPGAVFYGWLVAVALTILLVGIISAIATGVGSSLDVTQSEAELRAGTIGVASAIALLACLAIGYFAGGYVAGRLARFDGARQGIGVWALGLVVTIIVAVVGAIFGDEYNVFDRVNLSSLPVRADEATSGGIITLVAVLVGTLLTAALGGMLGQRYHSRIDRTVR